MKFAQEQIDESNMKVTEGMNMQDDENNHGNTPASADEGQTSDADMPKTWQKNGPSPNPRGRPKTPRNIAELRELAREKTGAMLEFLANTALNAKAPIGVRVTAATEILNRGWGRPQQSVDVSHGIQDSLVTFLEEIDARNKAKVIEGAVVESALAIEQLIPGDGQDGSQDSVPVELGPDGPDKQSP